MIVVSNATPLCYLTLIGHEDILAKLYGDIQSFDIPLRRRKFVAWQPLRPTG
jgi:hypothetical protein